jgi:hypothetical protein
MHKFQGFLSSHVRHSCISTVWRQMIRKLSYSYFNRSKRHYLVCRWSVINNARITHTEYSEQSLIIIPRSSMLPVPLHLYNYTQPIQAFTSIEDSESHRTQSIVPHKVSLANLVTHSDSLMIHFYVCITKSSNPALNHVFVDDS